MSSRYDVGTASIEATLFFRPHYVTAADLTAEGVLVLDNDMPAGVAPWIILEPGLVLHGISTRDGGSDSTEEQAGRYIVLTCGPGDGYATLLHESPSVVADPADRFRISGGSRPSIYIDRRPVQIYNDGTVVRWMAPDWSSTFLHVYESNGSDYEIVAYLADLGEGQGVGVNVQLSLFAESGGIAYAATHELRGSGRRATGGATQTPTFTASSDGGNMPGDLVELVAVGDLIALRVKTTYVGTVTVTWNQAVRPSALVHSYTRGVAVWSISNAGDYVGADGDYPATQASTTGNGSGATFTATLAGGVVTSVQVTAVGSGYAVGDTITLALVGPTENTPAVIAVDYVTS